MTQHVLAVSTAYCVFAPSDLDVTSITLAGGGDYDGRELREATRHSRFCDDVVGNYLKIAPGKQGVTFAPDVETATEIAARYNAAGVCAEMVSAKTPDKTRDEMFHRFRSGDLKQIVTVNLSDLPACEVVIMARPTRSRALFRRQFFAALRPLSEETNQIIIIDHVGNVARHGLPYSEDATCAE